MTASRQLGPNPLSFGSMFWENQFKTKIPLPPKDNSLNGRVAIITGANSGLGFESSKQMLGAGLSRLIMGVRSVKKGQDAAAQMRSINPKAVIEVWEIDMESYSSVQAFARRCEAELQRIDFVILNAGMVPANFKVLDTGHETMIQVNYLSTILLTILLLPVLRVRKPADRAPRLASVSTATVRQVKFVNRDKRPLLASFDDTSITPFDSQERYAMSKLLGQLTIEKIADEYVDPKDVVVTLIEPGWVRQTGLMREVPAVVKLVLYGIMAVAGRAVDQGAATYYDAVVKQSESCHGSYVMNRKIAPFADFAYTEESKGVADALWKETMSELSFANALQILESMKKR